MAMRPSLLKGTKESGESRREGESNSNSNSGTRTGT